jgi:hypothetical protein
VIEDAADAEPFPRSRDPSRSGAIAAHAVVSVMLPVTAILLLT